jgi:putative transposase
MRERIVRNNPAEGVYIFRGQPTIVFLTVCALRREPVLANSETHAGLVQAWQEADAWRVGLYLIMPNHIHLFCSPASEDHTIESWITFWKRRFRRVTSGTAPRFQSRGFHHRLRRDENYHQQLEYVRANPVRAGLVKKPEDWLYQGALNELIW